MSLEAKIDALTAAIATLTARIEGMTVPAGAVAAQAPAAPYVAAPVAAPVAPPVAPPVAAPVAAPVPPAPVAAPVAAMPAPPTFAAPPAAAPAAPTVPFTDGKGLIDYVMQSYKTLGPQKGASIQGVLTGLGYQNINDVKPEHYGALFTGVEALKG